MLVRYTHAVGVKPRPHLKSNGSLLQWDEGSGLAHRLAGARSGP